MLPKKSNTKLYIILPLVLLFFVVAEVFYVFKQFDVSLSTITTYSTISISIIWIMVWAINIRFVERFPTNYLRFIVVALYSIAIVLVWWFIDSYLIAFFDDLNFLAKNHYWILYHQCKTILFLILIFSITIISILIALLNKNKNLIQHQTNTEILHKEAELFKLRQQFNAHFIFNSLNAINALVSKQPEDAKKMLITLSEYLRSNIKKEENNISTLANELSDLQHYLSIEQYRFANRLKIKENINEECLPLPTPPFIVQPLIENAIKFGLYGTLDEVEITIDIKLQNNHLVITICNPFDPTGTMPKGTGFGLSAIKRRLYLLYQQNNLLQTEIINSQENNSQLFKAVLRLPIQK